MSGSYLTPQASVSNTTIEKKSRFITCISPVGSKDEAMAELQEIAKREVGANHNCYAYIVGNPVSPIHVHCSDDGEPSGTAGKPMLNILQYENIGNILVVVTRYFGGIKLGSGGLVRAYSNGLKMALEQCPLEEFVEKKRIQISFDYQHEGSIRYSCTESEVAILDTQYSDRPTFLLELLEDQVAPFSGKLRDITSGQVEIQIEENEN